MNEVDAVERLRAICLAFPQATEGAGVGDPAFKVQDKIFAMQHHVEGRRSMWCKAAPGAQHILVSSDPHRFFVPPYVGRHGWLGIWLDVELDWDELADLIEESYRLIAPRRISALLDGH